MKEMSGFGQKVLDTQGALRIMPFAICPNYAHKSAAAACALAGLLFLLTACPGNGAATGTFDDGSGETYAGSSSSGSSRSSGSGPSTVTISFEDIMKYSNSGKVDELARLFEDNSGGTDEEPGSGGSGPGTDIVILSASDIGLPAGGSVTLSITGGVEDYEETATAEDDGKVYFFVPRQAVGSEITVSLVVKKANGTVLCSGKKTMLVKAGIQFGITMKRNILEDFVFVAGNGTVGDLYVCIHEVTQGEYEKYCSYGGSSTPSSSGHGAGPDYPAYYVSWYDALVYCNLRSMAEGLTPCYSIGGSTDPAAWGAIPTSSNATWNAVTCNSSTDGYRLPTEAEWEYAARGGPANDPYTYSGSDTLGDVAWYDDNSGTGGGPSSSGGKAHEVKTKAPNSAGIYDMSGNVYEWCWDKLSSSSPYRVMRGGTWSHLDFRCEVSDRNNDYPYTRSYFLGFRVVRNAN